MFSVSIRQYNYWTQALSTVPQRCHLRMTLHLRYLQHTNAQREKQTKIYHIQNVFAINARMIIHFHLQHQNVNKQTNKTWTHERTISLKFALLISFLTWIETTNFLLDFKTHFQLESKWPISGLIWNKPTTGFISNNTFLASTAIVPILLPL